MIEEVVFHILVLVLIVGSTAAAIFLALFIEHVFTRFTNRKESIQ